MPRRSTRKMEQPGIFEKSTLQILRTALGEMEKGYSMLPSNNPSVEDQKTFERVILEAAERMKDNYPYFHPFYAGQMLKPPHPIARIAYMLSMWINPNNHALDGGRASSNMEKEAVAEIARMFGWKKHLGHLTGGGTMANLEALWVAGQLNPGKKVVASQQAHYTHSRITAVLGLEFEPVACDRNGRMDVEALKKYLDYYEVGTVVATIGTTAAGAVDPLDEIVGLQREYGFRLHADAAYGGYFILAGNLDEQTRKAYDRISEVDSIVVDPHKHGLQPYGCGCVIFRDPSVARFYKHDSPYTYFTGDESSEGESSPVGLHLGEISLECSRPGASAVALWATQRFLPLVHHGEFATSLEKCRTAALELHRKLKADGRFITPFQPELDIVIWAPVSESVTRSSEYARKIFDEAAKDNLHLALVELPAAFFETEPSGMTKNSETITCLRSVLMKPEHLDWLEEIWKVLGRAADRALSKEVKT